MFGGHRERVLTSGEGIFVRTARNTASGGRQMVVTGGTSQRSGRGSNDHQAGGGMAVWGRPVLTLIGGGALIWGVLSLIGYGIVHTSAGRSVVQRDTSISRWFFQQRTPTLNDLTHYGTMLSDTLTAIVVTVVVVGILLLRRRWQTALVVVTAILGELFVFVLITATIGRSRPPVPHLDPAPPTSSFPSGHTAAAVALYLGFVVLLYRSAISRALVVPLSIVLCIIPFIVAVSRMYRGMHYLTDVIFGFIGGGCWLLVTLYVLLGPPARALWERYPTAGSR
jgi:membrane-associated phospholipid phosphatase